ncbi:MAG: outer membrane beta-barrel protein [Candidatus Alcyoniella australis]|nr:outer membrane beta-barrel protein [Candidatus Alcyoniella australis]
MKYPKLIAVLSLALLLSALSAQPCAAVTERELGLAAQGGYELLLGEASDVLDGGPCFGINVSYGLTRWFGLALDSTYGMHSVADEEKYGKLDLTLVNVLAGPRFTLDLDPVFPYAQLLAGASIWRYDVEYEQDDGETFTDDDQRGRGALAASLGFDAALSDNFQLGINGRYFHLLDGLNLPNAHDDLHDVNLSGVQIMLRAGLIF